MDSGITEVLSFRLEKGWVLRCNFWPQTEGISFLHILLGEEKEGWKMFLNMLKSFKSKHDYIKWYSEQSKLKMSLSEDANRLQEEKIDKHKVKPKKESSVLDSKKQSTQHQWIIFFLIRSISGLSSIQRSSEQN